MLFDDLSDRCFRMIADELVDRVSVFEEEDSRDATDVKPGGRIRVLVYIHFINFQFSLVLAGNLLDRRSEQSAGAAPFRPEIDQD